MLTNIDWEDKILILAEKVDLATAQEIINKLEHTMQQVERHINARLALEVFMLDLPDIP